MLLSPTVLLREATILVVDDEEPLRRYLSRALEDAGYRVLAAREGSEALGHLRKSRFPVQLVITDIFMPGMTGLEFASYIATEPFPPPVLFISGDHSLLDVPGPVLRKPFLFGDLNPMVELLLRRPHQPVAAKIRGPSVSRGPARSCVLPQKD